MSTRTPTHAPWPLSPKSSPNQNAYMHQIPVYGQLTPPRPASRQTSITTDGGTYSDPRSPYTSSGTASSSSAPSPTASEDLTDYMSARLKESVNPLPYDRILAGQAQTSGNLNARLRELAHLQALATKRLSSTRANFADGIVAAREVSRELEEVHGRVVRLNARVAGKWPAEMSIAEGRYEGVVEREC